MWTPILDTCSARRSRARKSVKQSLTGLYKEIVSLSTLRTQHCDDDQQTGISSTGEIFFSSVPDGVFNLVTSFTNLKKFGRLHCVID